MKNKTKIWIVSELFYPEDISTGYIMTEISKSLSSSFNIEVICGPHNYSGEYEIAHSNNELPFRIHRAKGYTYNKKNLLKRLIGNLFISISIFSLMIKKVNKNDNILMVSNPIILVWLVSFICKLKRWRVKLIVHDVFPENLSVLSNKKNYYIKLMPMLRFVFNRMYKKIDLLILLGRDMQSVMRDKVNSKVKSVIIENWADTKSIEYKFSLNGNLKFVFAGNFGKVQGIEILLQAISNIDTINCEFKFIGDGAMKEFILNFIKDNNLKNVTVWPRQTRDSQNIFLNDTNIGIVTLAKGMYGLGVPSKVYNLLAAGKPIFYIGDKNSEIHLMLKEYKVGWFAEAGNIDAILNTLNEILSCDEETLIEYSKNARKLSDNIFSKEKILSKYNLIFENEDSN